MSHEREYTITGVSRLRGDGHPLFSLGTRAGTVLNTDSVIIKMTKKGIGNRESGIGNCFFYSLLATRRVAHTAGGVKIPLLLPTLLPAPL
jgi:hypothetical protein